MFVCLYYLFKLNKYLDIENFDLYNDNKPITINEDEDNKYEYINYLKNGCEGKLIPQKF